MNVQFSGSSVCLPGSLSIDLATRDPLAVLLLSTDILREYGGRLSSSVLKEQLAAMHEAALELSLAMDQGLGDC